MNEIEILWSDYWLRGYGSYKKLWSINYNIIFAVMVFNV